MSRMVTNPARKARGWPTDVWREELVGVRHYPKSQAAWDKRKGTLLTNIAKARLAGTSNRRGVPDGRAGQKEQLEIERRNSQTAAERLLPVFFPEMTGDLFGDEKVAAGAMLSLLGIVCCAHTPHRLRLSAAKTVLAFTAWRPVDAAGMVLKTDGLLHLVDRLGRIATG